MASSNDETKTKKTESSSESETVTVNVSTPSKSKKNTSTQEKGKRAKSASPKEASSEKEEGKYKELWEKGISKGLIGKDRQPEYRFSRMVNKKELLTLLSEYKNADKKTKKKMAADFEENLADKISKADVKKSTAKKNGTHKKHHDKDKSHKKHNDKSSHKKGGTHKKGSEDKASGTPLMQLWSKAMEKGLIEEGNQWHRELTDFITYSELKVLYSQYKEAQKKDEVKNSFNEKIKAFNDSIPEINRYFKVFRSYPDVWKAATAAKLIADDVKMEPSYANWLPSKTLVAYIATVNSLPASGDRKSFRGVITPLIAAKIEQAIESTNMSQELKEMNNKDLFARLKEKGFTSSEVSLSSKRVDRLNLEDMATAYMSWQKQAPDSDLAKDRQAQWNSYLEYLSEE